MNATMGEMAKFIADEVCKKQNNREQRRYEIARDVLCSLISTCTPNLTHPANHVEMSIIAADALLAELGKEIK